MTSNYALPPPTANQRSGRRQRSAQLPARSDREPGSGSVRRGATFGSAERGGEQNRSPAPDPPLVLGSRSLARAREMCLDATMQDHRYSFEIDATPQEIWSIFWTRRN